MSKAFTYKHPHPLQRGGLSRPERAIAALAEGAHLDGRGLSDLLHFWYEYARQVNYFNWKEGEDEPSLQGDWVEFFRKSIPFQYANIAAFSIVEIDQRYQSIFKSAQSRHQLIALNPLLDLLLGMLNQLGSWREDLDEDIFGLKEIVIGVIDTSLSLPVDRIVGLVNAAGAWGYTAALSTSSLLARLGIDSLKAGFHIDRSISAYRGSQKNKTLAGLKILDELYQVIRQALATCNTEAKEEKRLENMLRSPEEANTSPHLGLIFTFLLLYRDMQQGLNRLSEAHLDFFYRKTLQLKELPEKADQAHVIFSLARQAQKAIELEKGLRLKAGKDANGVEVLMELGEDMVVSATKVADLKTLYLSPLDEERGNIHATQSAKTLDGLEADFVEGVTPAWPSVGARQSTYPHPETGQHVAFPKADLGWLVASPVLFLREGQRTVTFEIELGVGSKSAEELINTWSKLLGRAIEIDEEVTLGIEQEELLFNISFSTADGWVAAPFDNDSFQKISIGTTTIKLSYGIKLDSEFPVIENPGQETLGVFITNHIPAAQFLLNPLLKNRQKWYCDLGLLSVREISVSVEVCGIRQLVIQNDFGLLDPSKPFMPFGPQPKAGSSKFILGSEEVFVKNWRELQIEYDWEGLPEPLDDYYASYPENTISEEKIEATVRILKQGQWKEIQGYEVVGLINDEKKDSNKLCGENQRNYLEFSFDQEDSSIFCDFPLTISEGLQTNSQCGFLELKLGSCDFLHDQYAAALTQYSIGAAESFFPWLGTQDDTAETAQAAPPNPPYTPVFENLRLNYSAEDRLGSQGSNMEFGYWHPWPGSFKWLEISKFAPLRRVPAFPYLGIDRFRFFGNPLIGRFPIGQLPDPPVLPPFRPNVDLIVVEPEIGTDTPAEVQNTNTRIFNNFPLLPFFPAEGHLFIGLENYQPGELVLLYFEMEPSTANPDLEKAEVYWSYLIDNDWVRLAPELEVISDSTNGLVKSGIIKLAIPSAISRANTTILPSHLHWLRAEVEEYSAAIAHCIQISTQGAAVQFLANPGNDLKRLASPLAAERISKVDGTVNFLKGVTQPFPGFGGRAPESAEKFRLRISELLRHKGRAVGLNDYERLILAEFPQVHRVKCLTHTLTHRGATDRDLHLAPGHVGIVVVPELKRVRALNPFEPRLTAADLSAIEKFLAELVSPFVKLQVLNPIYETIQIRLDVKLKTGRSSSFYREQLRTDLMQLLAPWTREEYRGDISFGGRFHYSTAVQFVENLEYVDYLNNLEIVGGEDEGKYQQAKSARSVLTTVNHNHPGHIIQIIE